MLIHIIVIFLVMNVESVRIENCPSGSVDVVADTANFSLTCVEYTGTVDWSYKTPTSNLLEIGTCGSSCQVTDPAVSSFFTLTRLSATSSRLDLISSATAVSSDVYTYFFGDKSCTVNIVVHAVLSTPTITVTTPATGSGWTVRGNVDITRIFSADGKYPCIWSVKQNGGSFTEIVNKNVAIDTPSSSTSVRTGHCDFPDRSLSSDPGTYTYRVTVSPGQTTKTDTSVVVETPATPNIKCSPSAGYVLEDGEVNCTCTGDVGRPDGRLRWLRENNNVITAVKDGQYGDATLQMTLTVNGTHYGSKLRCDVDWITDVTGPHFTLLVACMSRSI